MKNIRVPRLKCMLSYIHRLEIYYFKDINSIQIICCFNKNTIKLYTLKYSYVLYCLLNKPLSIYTILTVPRWAFLTCRVQRGLLFPPENSHISRKGIRKEWWGNDCFSVFIRIYFIFHIKSRFFCLVDWLVFWEQRQLPVCHFVSVCLAKRIIN